MKKLAFTIAFGAERYTKMAKALEASFKKNTPGVEFKIFTEKDITDFNEGLPKDRELYAKDYKYPKIEIMSKLMDPDTKYMFIDADTFVTGNIEPYFDLIKNNQLMIEYVYNGDSGWAGINNLQFSRACSEAGIDGIEPYSINSGFIVWHGRQTCFDYALNLIKSKTINDPKGRKGDEYYICAGIQKTNTDVVPIDYSIVKLGKYWNGKLSIERDSLICSFYPQKDRIIQHYGNNNFDSPNVQKTLKKYGVNGFSYKGYFLYKKITFKNIIKKILICVFKYTNEKINNLGYRIVKSNNKYKIEKNLFFNEFKVYSSLFNKDSDLTIFDVGAYVGNSVESFKKYYPNSKIHCFEPSEDNFSKLDKKYKSNVNIYLNNVAVGNSGGQKKLYKLGHESTGNSLIKPSNASAFMDKQKVMVYSIDDYCLKNNIEHIDILKIDTQGYEKECLEGAKAMLEQGKIGCIKLEIMFHKTYSRNTSFYIIEEVLQPAGYCLFDISWMKKSSRKKRTLVADIIYSKVENY